MKNIHEIMKDAQVLKESFIERKLFLAGQLGVLDKEINSLIKDNAYKEIEDEVSYSLAFRTKLKDLETKRRVLKDEFKIICEIDEDNKFTYNMLGYTINEYSKMNNVMNRLKNQKNIKFKNNGTLEYSIEGKSNEEIDEIIKKLKTEYSKVFVNKEEGKISCYNKCRAV